MSKLRHVYLVDYACCKPPDACRAPFATFMKHSHIILSSDPESVNFQMKVLARSGLGDDTYLPPAIHHIPPAASIEACRKEFELVIFSALDALLEKTELNPHDVDILVVNCGVFSPVPSLCTMIISKYKMRDNIKSFNLSGMGCSASLISINLVHNLLQTSPNLNAIVVSTEIITLNYYDGKERSMLLPNCLFRMGGACIFLSNKKHFRNQAKYQLLHVTRTHTGACDKAYKCIHEKEDEEGKLGISLSKDLTTIASMTLKANVLRFAPLVLPVGEQILWIKSLLMKNVFKIKSNQYIPNFRSAFEHFCIHAGGRGVINEIQKKLGLSWEDVEASKMTLHRFGNTSSSSLWYELSYIEAKGRMKKGDRVWQIALGSGFKCNSAVWKCSKNIKTSSDGPWIDCIDRYPIHLS